MDGWDVLGLLGIVAVVAILGLLALVLVGAGVSSIIAWRSPRSRADRALQNKGLAEALRILTLDGKPQEVRRYLSKHLPNWPVRALIVSAAEELMQLRAAADLAQASGVPENLTGRLSGDAETALDALWERVEQIATVKAQGLSYEAMRPDMEQEGAHLLGLIEAALRARRALAGWTLADQGNVERAELELRALAQGMEAVPGGQPAG